MATTADEHGVALVTGGAVRVGREISLTLARAGFAVAINYRRSRDAAEHLVGELRDAGCAAAAFQADITRHDEVEALVERVEADLGPTAVLDTGRVEIVVISRHHEPWDLGIFTSVGIDPRHKRYLLLKSRIHYRAGFAPIARHALTLDGEGVTTSDNRLLDYEKVRRPIYPLDRPNEP